jgi:hypothetical protein
VLASKRSEYAIDRAHRARLAALAKERGVSPSALLAQLIDEAHAAAEEAAFQRRREAVAWFRNANLEQMPDPETLSRQIDETSAVPDLPRR